MATPWMAGAETLDGKPPTTEGPMLFNGFSAIGAAGGRVPAFSTKKWRYGPLVKADKPEK